MPRERAQSAEEQPPINAEAGKGGLDRRALLGAAAMLLGLAGEAPGQGIAADPMSPEVFGDLLSALTGFSPRDVTLVEAFRDAFSGELAGLKTLSEIVRNTPEDHWPQKIREAGLEPLAESLIGTAYTGISGDGSQARVITYLNAFVWYACGYTKPPSQCDWNFGAWAYPPPRGRFDE